MHDFTMREDKHPLRNTRYLIGPPAYGSTKDRL